MPAPLMIVLIRDRSDITDHRTGGVAPGRYPLTVRKPDGCQAVHGRRVRSRVRTYQRVGVPFFAPVAASWYAGPRPRPVTGSWTPVADRRLARAGGAGRRSHRPGRRAGSGARDGGRTAAGIQRDGLTQAIALLGDAERAEELLPGERFDVVLAGMMLYFLPDPPAAVRVDGRVARGPAGGWRPACWSGRARPRPKARAGGAGAGAGTPGAGGAPFQHRLSTPRTGGLRGGGLSGVRCADVVFEVVIEAGQVLDWLWSAARRAALESIPPSLRAEARAALQWVALTQDRYVLARTCAMSPGRAADEAGFRPPGSGRPVQAGCSRPAGTGIGPPCGP